jgi:hypothetical protein
MAESTAMNCTYIVMTLLYCGPLPLMLPFLVIYIFGKYWIDKINVLRLLKAPPQFDEKIFERSVKIVQFGIILHILFSWWVYANQDIFPVEVTSKNGSLTHV